MEAVDSRNSKSHNNSMHDIRYKRRMKYGSSKGYMPHKRKNAARTQLHELQEQQVKQEKHELYKL